MLIDLASLGLTDPLLEASLEVSLLPDQLTLLEDQISYVQRSHRLRIDAYIAKERLTPDDPEWHEALQDHYQWIDLLVPRFMRGTFLISLYTVYETVVAEVADVLQADLSEKRKLKNYGQKNASFLAKARGYYSNVLKLALCNEAATWERLDALRLFRNALAHVNGRLELIESEKRKDITVIFQKHFPTWFSPPFPQAGRC